MITALTTFPTSPPVQLGGTTDAFRSGQSMSVSFFRMTAGGTTDVVLLAWSPGHQKWFQYPVDKVSLDLVFGPTAIQRYVLPHTSNGLYCTYYNLPAYMGGTPTVLVDTVLGD